jgi:hypothetical protein
MLGLAPVRAGRIWCLSETQMGSGASPKAGNAFEDVKQRCLKISRRVPASAARFRKTFEHLAFTARNLSSEHRASKSIN